MNSVYGIVESIEGKVESAACKCLEYGYDYI